MLTWWCWWTIQYSSTRFTSEFAQRRNVFSKRVFFVLLFCLFVHHHHHHPSDAIQTSLRTVCYFSLHVSRFQGEQARLRGMGRVCGCYNMGYMFALTKLPQEKEWRFFSGVLFGGLVLCVGVVVIRGCTLMEGVVTITGILVPADDDGWFVTL